MELTRDIVPQSVVVPLHVRHQVPLITVASQIQRVASVCQGSYLVGQAVCERRNAGARHQTEIIFQYVLSPCQFDVP